MKPKVILDIGFLGHAFEEKTERRGAQRVAHHLFDGLLAGGAVDLSFVATTYLSGAFDLLKSRGMDPAINLHHDSVQLARSRKGREIAKSVHDTVADRSWLARVRRRALAQVATFYLAKEGNVSRSWLDGHDIYHSPHRPFPPAVHDHGRIRKFLTCHDFIPLKNPEYFNRSGRPFMNAVLACLKPDNFAFCVSEHTRNDVLNLTRMPAEHVFVTPLAADRGIFKPITDRAILDAMRKRFNLGDEPYFLALSAQDRHKNFPHLIKCMGALFASGEIAGYNLVIVGSNPGRNPEVVEAIARCGQHRGRIIIPGFVPDECLAAIYSGATAFLFPSLAEGFGIPPLEAMQCGVPVITSNTTSMPEVVGDAGILLPPTDEAAWCQAISQIARDASLREDLSRRSLLRAGKFSWERFIGETLRGYRYSMGITT